MYPGTDTLHFNLQHILCGNRNQVQKHGIFCIKNLKKDNNYDDFFMASVSFHLCSLKFITITVILSSEPR